jgi:hypothetical protein
LAERRRSGKDLRRTERDTPLPIGGDFFLTPEELALRWKIHVDTLARWRGAKKGPAHTMIGGNVRYPLAGITNYEAERAALRP